MLKLRLFAREHLSQLTNRRTLNQLALRVYLIFIWCVLFVVCSTLRISAQRAIFLIFAIDGGWGAKIACLDRANTPSQIIYKIHRGILIAKGPSAEAQSMLKGGRSAALPKAGVQSGRRYCGCGCGACDRAGGQANSRLCEAPHMYTVPVHRFNR